MQEQPEARRAANGPPALPGRDRHVVLTSCCSVIKLYRSYLVVSASARPCRLDSSPGTYRSQSDTALDVDSLLQTNLRLEFRSAERYDYRNPTSSCRQPAMPVPPRSHREGQ